MPVYTFVQHYKLPSPCLVSPSDNRLQISGRIVGYKGVGVDHPDKTLTNKHLQRAISTTDKTAVNAHRHLHW